MFRSEPVLVWTVFPVLFSIVSCIPHKQSEIVSISPDDFVQFVGADHYGHIESNLISGLTRLGTMETDVEFKQITYNISRGIVTLVGQTTNAVRSDILPGFDVMTATIVPSDDVRDGYRFQPEHRVVSDENGRFTITAPINDDTKLVIICMICPPIGHTVMVYNVGKLLERYEE